MENLIIAIVTGMLAGWLAGVIMKGSGFGLLGNLIVGVLGAVIGTWLFRVLGMGPTAGSESSRSPWSARSCCCS